LIIHIGFQAACTVPVAEVEADRHVAADSSLEEVRSALVLLLQGY